MNLRDFTSIHGQALLASRLGVTPALISQWLSGKTRITAERAAQIEAATRGAVTRAELRPDIFGPIDDDPGRGDA